MANAAAGALVVSLGLDAAEFTSGLSKAEQAAKQSTSGIQDSIKSMADAVAGYLSVDAIVSYTRSLIDAQEQLGLMSEKTGIAVDALGGIGKAAEKSGMSLQSASMMLSRLGVNIAHAAEGVGPASKAFEAMGLSAKDLAKMPVEEVFLKLTDKFNSYADGSKKNALAQAAFNRSFQEIIPLLNMGSAAIDDNIKYYREHSNVTLETTQKAREFNDTLIDLKTLAEGAGNEILKTIVPSLTEMAKEAKNLNDHDDVSLWAKSASIILETVAIIGITVADTFKGIGREIGAIAAQGAALAHGDLTAVMNIHAEAQWDADEAAKAYEKLTKRISDAGSIARGEMAKPIPAYSFDMGGTQKGLDDWGDKLKDAPSIPKGGGDRKSEGQRYIESLQAQLEKTKELTVYEKLLNDIRDKRVKFTASEEAHAKAIALSVDAKNFETEAEKISEEQLKKSNEAILKQGEAYNKSIEAELKQIDVMQKSNVELEKQIDLVGKNAVESAAIENAYLDQTIALDKRHLAFMAVHGDYTQEYIDLQAEIKALEERQRLTTIKADWETFNDPEKKVKDLAAKTEETMSESLANGIMEGFRQGHSLADVFLNELKAQFAKTVLTPMMKPIVEAGNDMMTKLLGGIMSMIGPGGGSLGGTSYQFTSGDVQGLFGDVGYGAYAGPYSGGGPVSGGSLSRVNELRPEGLNLNGQQFLLMGSQGGNIDNNPNVGGQGVQINQTLNVGDGVSRNDLAAAMVFAKEQAKAEIMRSMRTGGAFARN